MRKWIFSTTVFVLALVAWKLYLDDDLKRFTQNLPKAPAPTQDLAEPPARIITTPVNVEPEEPTGNVSDDTSDIPANVPVEITDTATTAPFFQDRFVEQTPEPEDTGLSPELEVLFSVYYPIQQRLEEVSKVLNPILDRHHLGTNRIREILLEELPAAADGPERQALYAEIDEIHAWKESVKQETFELQDERHRLSEERSTLLAEYGISSWQEFNDIHRDDYNTWKAEQ